MLIYVLILILATGPALIFLSNRQAEQIELPLVDYFTKSALLHFVVRESGLYLLGFITIWIALLWFPIVGFLVFGKTDGNVLIAILTILLYYNTFRFFEKRAYQKGFLTTE